MTDVDKKVATLQSVLMRNDNVFLGSNCVLRVNGKVMMLSDGMEIIMLFA